MKNFLDSERRCQTAFLNAGPLWFASSPGKQTPILFATREDMTFVMNVIAQSAYLFPNLEIIAFEVMNNHFHFIIGCIDKSEIPLFFSALKKRLLRHCPQIKPAELDIRPIDDLSSIRNRIVYTHRNGYVANPDCTPFSYPWGTGRYYFNGFPITETLSDYKVDSKRQMFRGRDPGLPSEWKIIEKHVAPPSFCLTGLGMSFFRDAHHYFSLLTKNVEAYAGLAEELGDGEFLTDSELFSQLQKILRENYRQQNLKTLTRQQKLDLARTLHYDFRSSNGQICRLLGLTPYEVDALFPLSASSSE